MYISLADLSHKKELIDLWAETFGDGEKFISSFLDAYMIPEYNVPVIIENAKIASVLYLIDFPLYSNRNNLGDCAYLFAAATKKEHRNKGCMSQLISYSAELCKNRGLKAIFLFPQDQDKKLFDFYSKFGFKTIYAAKKIKTQTPAISNKVRKSAPFQKGAVESGFRLVDQDITNAEIFDGLYNSYAEFTAKQELAPMKDRLFYFKCASSYLENPDARFAVFEKIHGKPAENTHNVDKFCYVFYKKYKNTYYIDDIIHSKYADLLADFLLNSPDHGVNLEINLLLPATATPATATPLIFSDSQTVPLAMLLPLSGEVCYITENLKSPVYINMFMNI